MSGGFRNEWTGMPCPIARENLVHIFQSQQLAPLKCLRVRRSCFFARLSLKYFLRTRLLHTSSACVAQLYCDLRSTFVFIASIFAIAFLLTSAYLLATASFIKFQIQSMSVGARS